MKEEKNNEEIQIPEEIIYDEDTSADVVKKLRTRLRKCEKEKKEYLDGWQRLKADTLNARKQQTDALNNVKKRAVVDFVHNLLPSLDSFDIALKGDSWDSVDEVWRIGIQHVHTQLLNGLSNAGIESFGEVGDIFDINIHEAISHDKKKTGKSGTISKVERRGYKMGDTIIRPAHVVVYN